MDKELPKCAKSTTLVLEPKRAIPNNEILLPILTKLRTDKELPNCPKSNKLAADPKRLKPEIETLLPHLA
jgi:hypothetical protein